MAEEKTIITRSNPEDLNRIVLLYKRHMFESCLIQLGRGYIDNFLSYIIKSQDCITLVAKNNQIAGFIMATLNSRKFFYGLVFKVDQILFQSIYFLKYPVKYFRILELLFYPFRSRLKNTNAELLFVAIEPDYRNQDLGKNLIFEVLKVMKEKSIKHVKVTANLNNTAVNRLLSNFGFKKERVFNLFNSYHCLYSYELR